ncbi:MAG TPA: monovalent cation/H+ antiporter complex subunit F [Thermoanaerobaculia bacterium]|nr:monovalent cation/H+ antiporter complex subunit F [Thermoanaerobaculia bacterium]
MTLVVTICFVILGISMLLAFWRLWRGPSLPDRVVAFDLIAVIAVAMIIVLDVATELVLFLDPAIVVALVGFAGTIAFARYLERRVL